MVIILGCKLQDAFAFCMIHGREKHSGLSGNLVMLFMPLYTDDAFEALTYAAIETTWQIYFHVLYMNKNSSYFK